MDGLGLNRFFKRAGLPMCVGKIPEMGGIALVEKGQLEFESSPLEPKETGL